MPTTNPIPDQPPSSPPDTGVLMDITPRPDRVMVRGAGSYLFDSNGRRYLDFIQGWAVNALGHCPPEIARALAEQASTLITPSPALHNQPAFALASHLAQASGLAQAHFANSGAEANEAAVKLARKAVRAVGRVPELEVTDGGLDANYLNQKGVPTVTLALLESIAKAVRPPRALWVPFPHGYPLGAPHDAALQTRILRAALDLAVEHPGPGPVLARWSP